MTEADARNKWCPFSRLGESGSTYNRCGPNSGVNCIGSDCMAWRVEPRLSIDNASKVPGRNQHIDTSHGYCGLAGKP